MFLDNKFSTGMEDSERHEKIADEEEIEKNPNCERSDQCAEGEDSFGVLKNEESVGFVFDKCTIGSAMVSDGVSRRSFDMNSAAERREFEFDLSRTDLNIQPPSIELESVESPADELFYKGRLLPLHAPLRIQMVEKLRKSVYSESQQKTQTENIGNSDNISGTMYDCEKLGFQTPCNLSDVAPSKVDKELNETCNNDTPPALDHSHCKELPDSPQSQPAVLAHKLKAPKAFVKSLFTKSANARGANDRLSQNGILSIKKQSDHEEATAIRNRIPVEKSLYRKSFSGSFNSIKGSLLIRKLNSKSLPSRISESPTTIGALRKRSMSCTVSDKEDGIQGAIAHCKQSQSADPRNATDTPINLQRSNSNPERYARGHVRRS